ncbi:pre-rRNA-processing protein TSR2-like [Rosa rugosa]|uniref:pre-rRNA-processing protein TSR2-like n=1 Tax=Rosa rugosa TaxID=74645 RepID=UPI002B40B882|nr:pre-rRNA-processing protein TSR2-like [Rosa rugosa]XP_061996056.1 pre-rRNA-processing protein TSR2-like [Rosa rugosa]XP_061996057.1 pre-rRNA-processing protein TSR2-like [Rosa rugosa]XP_061996058.1 pre-rRNA-processing protein TSR2-like [Rosa rugosa]XP_061996060.1 pre-rRNA-processing protein TSR2-like [Rosa rugosa]
MEPERKLTAAAVAAFQEGVGLVLSRWSALQLAVENEWGGRESRLKAEQLVSDIVSWVNFSTEPLYIDDLEEMLIEAMSFLNTVIEDGSIEEVAEKIMIMHEECLDCNFKSIESLREANSRRVPTPHVKQVVNDEEDSDEDDDDTDPGMNKDDSSNMIVDKPESHAVEPKTKQAVEAEDGWEVVGLRRSRGKRN